MLSKFILNSGTKKITQMVWTIFFLIWIATIPFPVMENLDSSHTSQNYMLYE